MVAVREIFKNLFCYVYKISLNKNWTSIIFLKFMFYLSFWIVLIYVLLGWMSLWLLSPYGDIDFRALYLFEHDLEFYYMCLCIPTDHHNYLSCAFDFYDFYNYCAEEYALTLNSLSNLYYNGNSKYLPSLLDNNYLVYCFVFVNLVVYFFKNLCYIWLLSISIFLFMHLYFSLNNVFKDYVRDISISLYLTYFFLSIFILGNLFYLIFVFIDLTNENVILQIIRASILYVLLYLCITFFVSKSHNTFKNLIKYMLISSFLVFIFHNGIQSLLMCDSGTFTPENSGDLFVSGEAINFNTEESNVFSLSSILELYSKAYDIGYLNIFNNFQKLQDKLLDILLLLIQKILY